MRGCIAHALRRQQIFRARVFSSKTGRNAEMPINEGFLRCHKSCRDEKIRHGRDRSRQIFSRTTLPAQPASQREKFFTQNAFSGVSKHLMRRKTRESVPSDSL
jgi:hypothetical protein